MRTFWEERGVLTNVRRLICFSISWLTFLSVSIRKTSFLDTAAQEGKRKWRLIICSSSPDSDPITLGHGGIHLVWNRITFRLMSILILNFFSWGEKRERKLCAVADSVCSWLTQKAQCRRLCQGLSGNKGLPSWLSYMAPLHLAWRGTVPNVPRIPLSSQLLHSEKFCTFFLAIRPPKKRGFMCISCCCKLDQCDDLNQTKSLWKKFLIKKSADLYEFQSDKVQRRDEKTHTHIHSRINQFWEECNCVSGGSFDDWSFIQGTVIDTEAR